MGYLFSFKEMCITVEDTTSNQRFWQTFLFAPNIVQQ